jgi:hypothetical protein
MGLAKCHFKTRAFDSASFYYRECMHWVKEAGFRFDLYGISALGLARIFHNQNRFDSAIVYARLSLFTLRKMKKLQEETEAAHSYILYTPGKL